MRYAARLICLLALLLVGMGAGGAYAETLTLEMEFEAPQLRSVQDGAVIVEMPGCAGLGAPGHPLLPEREATLLLPPREEVVAVRAYGLGEHAVEGTHTVLHADTPRPISAPGPFTRTPADLAIYGSDEAYPSERAALVTVQRAWGHDVAFLRVSPVAYQPLSGTLVWYERIVLEVETAPSDEDPVSRFANLRRTPEVLKRLEGMIRNPGDLARYARLEPQRGRGSRLEAGNYPYVIITTEALEAAFHDLEVFESSRGLRARTMLWSEINATYPGTDDAEQMRAFIIDAYQTWGTEFVLLGGDRGLIPHRDLYVNAGGTTDQFPGDCYFEGLDGNWNDDGDSRWGEDGEYDLVGEVAVGRAPAANTTELTRWLHKNEMYTEQPVVSQVERALFLGERMDDLPTWGGDYMDEVKDEACTHGYCTSGYPDSYAKEMLYDRNGTWSKWDLINLFNSGVSSSHHLGHSYTDYTMKMYNSDVGHLTNDGVSSSYTIIYTQGCYSNNWDSNSPDTIGEKFFYDDNGAAAFVGNTRYGWYVSGSTGGPSQHFDRQFVDACYGEGITQVGWMNVDSKVDCIWQLTPWMLWCHYELCLLGDPAMPQWREVAGQLAMVHEGTYYTGQGDYLVVVESDGEPVAGATVTAYSADLLVWASAVTNADGVVLLDLDLDAPAMLQMKAVMRDYLPASEGLPVMPPTDAWLALDSVVWEDDETAPSFGDGDGIADAGETGQLLIGLRNIGTQLASGGHVALTCEDPRVVLEDAEASYGDIAAGGVGVNLDDLVIGVSVEIDEGDVVWMDLVISWDGRPSTASGFDLDLHAPILTLDGWTIEDELTGNGNGGMDPGESFRIRLTLANGGGDEGRELVATLYSQSLFLDIADPGSGCPLVEVGGVADLEPATLASLDSEVSTEQVIDFSLQVETWAGQVTWMNFSVPVASFYEDNFEATGGWTAGLPGDDATEGVWVQVDPIGTWADDEPVQPEDDRTDAGSVCFVTGQGEVGDHAMDNDVDRGKTTLVSPVFDLADANEPRLVYWRWFTNDLGPWAGLGEWHVDVSDDGGLSWVVLEDTQEADNSWRRMEFLLSDYIDLTSQVVVRFIAQDHTTFDSLTEAAVDDVSIETAVDMSGVEDGSGDRGDDDGGGSAGVSRAVFGIERVWPNPVSREGASRGVRGVTIGFGLRVGGSVRLQVFDVDGALVRTLVDGVATAGEHRVVWNGRDQAGGVVGSGIYFCRLKSGGGESVEKVVVVQ